MDKTKRSLLKGIGASLGIPSLTISEISVNAAADSASIVNQTKPFIHFTFETVDNFPSENKSVGCRSWPTVDTHSGKQTGSENRIYITKFARHSLDVAPSDGILLSHEGLQGLQNDTEASFSHVPSQTSLVGGVEFLEDTTAPSFNVKLEGTRCYLNFGSTDVVLQEGEEQEITHTTTLSNGKSAELTASAAYYGDAQLFGHTEKILVPQSSGWSNLVQTVKDIKQENGSVSSESITTKLQITEYEEINAFGIDASTDVQTGGS